MSNQRHRIVEWLGQEPVSGPTLAEELQISRAAVWKHIEALRAEGFDIESTPAGYEMVSLPEFGPVSLTYGLDAPYAIEFHEQLGSTNTRARELAYEQKRDIVVVADEQTAGRGRRERTWDGPQGGIYLSILISPEIEPRSMSLVTLAAAVSIANAIEEMGLQPVIKWPNDVLLDGNKVAGILTEMEAEVDRINWVIVGMGINANQSLADLPEQATSLQAVLGKAVDRRQIVHTILQTFSELIDHPGEIREEWLNRASTIGSRVEVQTTTGRILGKAVDLAEMGGLIIKTEDGTQTVYSGDCVHLESRNS